MFQKAKRFAAGNVEMVHRSPPTCRMEASSQTPDEDGYKVATLSADPVDELTGEETYECVEYRKHSRDDSIMGIRPMKLRSDEILPRQRKHLAVKVVDCGGNKQKAAKPPSPVGEHTALLSLARLKGSSHIR